MSLASGVRLGAYELLSLIGAGGMGEVYRARDTRLDRTVAIKVLPEQFAADPERRERFERECRAVAALNHPNICDLHDVGEASHPGSSAKTIRFLVMEYLEGQTLAEPLLKGPSQSRAWGGPSEGNGSFATVLSNNNYLVSVAHTSKRTS